MKRFGMLVLLVACENQESTDLIGYCDLTASDVEDTDESLGFSAEDVLAEADTALYGELGFEDGSESPLTLSLVRGEGMTQLVDSELAAAGNGQDMPAIAVECIDFLQIPVQLTASSEDGRLDLDEAFAMEADEFGSRFRLELVQADWQDLIDAQNPDPHDSGEVYLYVEMIDGRFEGRVTYDYEGGDSEVVWAASMALASF